MKVYLAAPYSMKEEIKKRAAELRALRIEVTSSWINEPHQSSTQLHELPHETHQFYALADVQDVAAAHILVLQDDPSIGRAGRHVEFGMAVGIGLTRSFPIFVVGAERANIFHHLPQVHHFDSWEETKQRLDDLAWIERLENGT